MVIKTEKYRNIQRILAGIVGVITIVPLAPLLNRYIPPLLVGSWNFDLLLAILISAIFTYLLLRVFGFLVVPAISLFLLVVAYNQFASGYGFGSMINDYRSLVRNNWGMKEQKEINLVFIPSFFDGPLTRTVKALESKIDYKDSVVRNFAVQNSLTDFREFYNKYGNTVRLLSLFRHINSNFQYVPDSQRDEYFATPRETILNGLGGDCDDHSILMVSAMRAIGGRARMILTEGHLYPELYCGNKEEFEKMQQAIIHLFGKTVNGNIFYHEMNGEYWLNLDYSARYPGGPYVSEKAFAIIE